MLVEEGGVAVEVPDPEDEDGSVFYNPEMELNRDVTVATLRTFERRRSGARTYLDAMAASGIRGVRAAADGWAVTLNDRGEVAAERCRHNLDRNGLSGRVTERDANALLHESRFDVVDLDPFGSPIPFADAAFVGARRLVCVTATDTAPLCGAHFRSGIRRYGAVPRNTDYHAEMGLRVLLSALARTAARYDLGVTPLVSHATRHYVRTYLELERGATVADAAIDELGYLHHCEDCLHREAEQGLLSHPWEGCPACRGNRVVTAGPVWLGRVRDESFTRSTLAAVDDGMGRAERARTLLEQLADELEVPTHFDQHRLSKLWGRPAESMDEFLGALRDAGFEASRTHYGGTTFKTDATVEEIASAIGA